MNRLFAIPFVALGLAGCTLAPMTKEAERVSVVSAVPQGCTPAGRIEVEVTNRVALIERNPLRVKDELETMARNEAAKIGANAVMAKAPPADGRQAFEAYRCVR